MFIRFRFLYCSASTCFNSFLFVREWNAIKLPFGTLNIDGSTTSYTSGNMIDYRIFMDLVRTFSDLIDYRIFMDLVRTFSDLIDVP